MLIIEKIKSFGISGLIAFIRSITQKARTLEFKVLIILFIGTIQPFASFLPFSNRTLKTLKTFSISPVVFSYKADAGKIFKKFKFDIYSDEQTFKTVSFNKAYYKKLPGPHRYKIFHFMTLKRKSMITNKNNAEFYKDIFCRYNDIKKAFEINFEIQRVVIREQQKVYHDFKCT